MSTELARKESPSTEGYIAHGHAVLMAYLPKPYHTLAKVHGYQHLLRYLFLLSLIKMGFIACT